MGTRNRELPVDESASSPGDGSAVRRGVQQRHHAGRPGESLLLALAAGSVDGIGYVLLHVFTAHITGNTVHMGTAFGEGTVAEAARSGFAILTFVLGILAGALLRDACDRRGVPSRATVLATGCIALAAVAVVGEHLGAPRHIVPGHWEFWVIAALAASAMGAQNAVASRVGGRRARTFITGIMTDCVEAIVDGIHARRGAEARSAWRRAVLLCAVWFAYAAGGVASGATATRWGTASVLVPIVALVLVIADDLARWLAGVRRPARQRA